MGKTYRRNRGKFYFRSIRGYKQAMIARETIGIRYKSIPPDPWEDDCLQHECRMINRAAENMMEQGWDREKIIHHLKRKFKVSHSEARESLPWKMMINDDWTDVAY